jgi:acetylornithine deacetylase/succinyl-diaminopimelate desuccinylase-like protein
MRPTALRGLCGGSRHSYAQSMEKCVCWGPIRQDEDKCFHEENEHYVLKHLLLACEIYTMFLYRMAADE